MSTQPSEHAMRAANENDLLDHAETLLCNAICPPHCSPEEWETIIRGWRDRKHAIAPAVAERDAVIGHLLQWCHDLRGEWQWKKDEPRAGNQADYEALCATIEAAEKLLTKGGSHE